MASPSAKKWKPSEIREQLLKVSAALDALNTERKALLLLFKGYEGWLSLYGNEPEESESGDAVS
ncbi:hypothetical protein LCGC14_1460930 [marine sediment metagenome]|uniref:Uncharacterized protein n=1 Tax=marine sediment metagenome TaxID=412755 RepID=A0A0F9JF49_9ZZZZ